VFLVRAPTCAVRHPTHCLPPGRHIPFAAACRRMGAWSRWCDCSKRWQRAPARVTAVWSAGTLGARG